MRTFVVAAALAAFVGIAGANAEDQRWIGPRVEPDAIHGTTVTTAFVEGRHVSGVQWPHGQKPPLMMARCDGSKYEVFIRTEQFHTTIMNRDNITYRVGDKVYRTTGNASTDGRFLFVVDRIDLSRRMMADTSGEVIMRVERNYSGRFDQAFPTTGVTAAVGPVMEACGIAAPSAAAPQTTLIASGAPVGDTPLPRRNPIR